LNKFIAQLPALGGGEDDRIGGSGDCLGQGGAKTGQMGAAIRIRDGIGERQNLVVIGVVVLKHDVDEDILFLAFDVLQIIVGKLSELLFHFSLGNVPVAFHLKRVHGNSMLVFLAALSAAINSSLQTVCRCGSVLHCLIKPAEFASSGGFQRVVLSAKCKEETEKVVASCIPFHARKTASVHISWQLSTNPRRHMPS